MTPQAKRWLMASTYASVAIAIVLILLKTYGWLMTGSTGVLASLLDSLMDGLSSLLNLFAVRYALRPADADHRFGHGKAEQLAALAQAAFIVGSALMILLHAGEGLLHPERAVLENTELGVGLMSVSLAITTLLVVFQSMAIRATGNTVLRADSLHYRSDLVTNLAIILGLFLAGRGWPQLDAVFGVAIAVYMCIGAAGIARDCLHVLMDRQLPAAVDDQIASLCLESPQVRGVHGLRTRQSGARYIIQLHLELDDVLTLKDAHAIVDTVEQRLLSVFPHADIIIHQDPSGMVEAGVRRWPAAPGVSGTV